LEMLLSLSPFLEPDPNFSAKPCDPKIWMFLLII
jgi:hypothetical protein